MRVSIAISVLAILLGLALAGCSSDVTGSDEYLALEVELASAIDTQDEAAAELDETLTELEEARSELDEARSELESADRDVNRWRDRATNAEDELEAELSKPWPDEAKALFVDDCAADPDPDLTPEQHAALCSCMVGGLEESVSFADFIVFSLSAIDPNAELNPITGIPLNVDERFAEILGEAVATCLFMQPAAVSTGGGSAVSVAVENAYPPFNYRVDDGSAVGFDYDIWREICGRIGCSPEFVEADWPALVRDTGSGQYDVAADGISITPERKAIVDFSDPYIVVVQRLMVRSDETRFDDAQEFMEGAFILGTQVGTTNQSLGIELVGNSRVGTYSEFDLAVGALLAGEVDAVIIDDISGAGYVGASANQTRLLPGELQTDSLGFAYPKGSELRLDVDQALEEMATDGTLEALVWKWFIEARN